IEVHGKAGLHGSIPPAPRRTPSLVDLELDTGGRVAVPVDLFEPRADGSFYIPLTDEEVRHLAHGEPAKEAPPDRQVIPIAEERVKVDKQRTAFGTTRVHVSVD